MIWFLIGIAPLVIIIAIGFFNDPFATFSVVGSFVVLMAFFMLAVYGAWELGWIENCGTFWESANCP
jgi:hypothetical protein